jgi:hypothetical protein
MAAQSSFNNRPSTNFLAEITPPLSPRAEDPADDQLDEMLEVNRPVVRCPESPVPRHFAIGGSALDILPTRLERYRGFFGIDIEGRKANVEIECPVVREAIGRLCDIVSGDIDVGIQQRAYAAAVLDSVREREVIEIGDESREIEDRWVVDDEVGIHISLWGRQRNTDKHTEMVPLLTHPIDPQRPRP